jgi:hypothetical protein
MHESENAAAVICPAGRGGVLQGQRLTWIVEQGDGTDLGLVGNFLALHGGGIGCEGRACRCVAIRKWSGYAASYLPCGCAGGRIPFLAVSLSATFGRSDGIGRKCVAAQEWHVLGRGTAGGGDGHAPAGSTGLESGCAKVAPLWAVLWAVRDLRIDPASSSRRSTCPSRLLLLGKLSTRAATPPWR